MKKLVATILITISTFTLTSCSMLNSKPSKSDVSNGLFKLLKSEAPSNVDDDVIHNAANCVADEIYNDLSKIGAETLAKGDKDGGGTDKDLDLLSKATDKCENSFR